MLTYTLCHFSFRSAVSVWSKNGSFHICSCVWDHIKLLAYRCLTYTYSLTTFHSDLFWKIRGGKSLGLKTTSCGVFLFVHDCLITHLSWKIHVRPKRSNFKWPWFFILYLIFSYENSSTYEQLSVKISKVFIGGAVFIWKYEV